jgi:hypothetical protein
MADAQFRHLPAEGAELRVRDNAAIEAMAIAPTVPLGREDAQGATPATLARLYAEAYTAVNPNTVFEAHKDPYGLQFQTMPVFYAQPPPRYPSQTTIQGFGPGAVDAVSDMARRELMHMGKPVEGGNRGEAVDIAVMKDKANPAEYF